MNTKTNPKTRPATEPDKPDTAILVATSSPSSAGETSVQDSEGLCMPADLREMLQKAQQEEQAEMQRREEERCARKKKLKAARALFAHD